MAVSYRNRFSNYLQEHRNSYTPVGAIFPVAVDSFSAPEDRNGAGSGGQSPEHGYQGYLYCDGSELKIRDYPHLYSAIKNTYGGAPRVEISTNGTPGSIRRTYWINGKMFINFYKDDDVESNDKRPYPYGIIFRFVDDTGDTPAGPGLGSLPSSIFAYDTIYGTVVPTEDTSSNTPTGEFAYEIVFPENVDVGTLPQTSTVVANGTHPNAIISKSFVMRDAPYHVGTFNLPDYRDRVIVGLGGVDGDGSPTVENALINNVGQVGGRWFIEKQTLLDGGLFFSVGDVKTRGYKNITADIFTFLTGSVEYRVGPTDAHFFNRPAEHFHNLLGSEADELTNSEFAATPVDEFAAMYSTSRANITAFAPVGSGGLPLSHSHGLTKEPLNDPSAATYGNTSGIGGYDPTTPADIFWDVSDPELLSYLHPLGDGRIGYDDVSLEPHGPGTGEWEGFVKPSIAQGNVYLAFGYGATATGFSNPGNLKTSRRVEYKLDFTGYTQLYVYAIAGNDNNGGERPNNEGEGLYCKFSNGESVRLFPSVKDFIDENSVGNSEGFDLYDAIHSQWKEFVIDIPAALQDQPDQVIVLEQDLQGGTEQGPSVPAGNDNANDMIGIQGIGLRGGISQPAVNLPGVYPITGSPIFQISTLTYDPGNNTVEVLLSESHSFDVGQYITIGGVNPAGFNGDYEIIEVQGNDTFVYQTDSNPGGTAGTGGIARLALGRFEEQLVYPDPRLYVVDNATVIGKKVQTVTVPGTGILFQEEELNSNGTFNMTPVAASAGTVTKIEVDLYGTGGGGANSTTDGTSGGYAYCTFEIDGQSFTVYANGGDGGQDGNSGGSGGQGGTVNIPAALLAAPYNEIVEIVTQDPGNNGGSGGAQGPGSTTGGLSLYGPGGDGTFESFQQTNSGSWTTYTQSGSYSAPGAGGNVVSRTIQVRAAGGGGGGGNGNANSGCQGSGATGGSGGPGALVTATINQSSFSWVLGLGGSSGFNNVDGYVNGTGREASDSIGGGGAGAKGGDGAIGAWGNGATAGAGGGVTLVYAPNGNAMFGAGGGGGGGGSGGGFNGGGTTDGCYAGGSWQSASVGLQQVSNALGVADGARGTQGGCTAGGGGGGGASAGPAGSASGGVGGQAGVGHNGNGGGTGGRQGDSAWRTTYVGSATIGSAGNGGGPGSNGGNGYVEIKVDETVEIAGNVGGAGGGGAHVFLIIKDRNVSVSAGLQGAGGGPSTGGNGYVRVQYRGTEGGGDVEGSPTAPAGRYYECDTSGVPSGPAVTSNIWKESSADGNVKDNYTKPVSPGPGSGSSGGFVMPGGGNGAAPKYGNRSTKYLPFSGPGSREYVLGPLDMRNVNKLKFSVAKGNNNNGGETPNEDLMVFYRETGGTTTTLLDAIVTSSETLTGWEEREIAISETSNVRGASMELVIRQTRPASQDDNASNTVDNYGISGITFFYDEFIEKVFIPSDGSTIEDIDYVDDVVTSLGSGIVITEGSFEMSSSTPISTTAVVSPESNIPLITRYHRAKYLIKAR